MEIKYLKLVRTIAEEGNISNSASRLFLTQSALSHQLREIEERLGFKIFVRSRHKWTLTEEGKELYELALKVLNEIEEALSKMQRIKQGTSGVVRISTECYTFYHGLPGFIQRMSFLYPEIDINMMVESTHQPIPKIISGELDMSLTTVMPIHDSLCSIELFEDEVFAILNSDHPFSSRSYLSAHDFSQLPLIIHSYPLNTVSVYEYVLKPQGVEPALVTAIPLTEVALEMVKANMGVVCLPKWALKSFDLSDHLVFKRIGETGFIRKHYLAYRKEDAVKSYISDFITNLQEEFN